jgi:hypothetical protein
MAHLRLACGRADDKDERDIMLLTDVEFRREYDAFEEEFSI